MTPAPGKVSLDTNVLIRLFNGDESIAERIDAADDVAISVVVLGELLYGARYSARPDEKLAEIARFVTSHNVLNCDRGTAEIYGIVKAKLRRLGKPIPENDVWIAAHALQFGVPLVTDDAHFGVVDGLTLDSW